MCSKKGGMIVIGIYRGYKYFTIPDREKGVVLLTRDEFKKIEGFESKRSYFRKSVDISDPDLTSLYMSQFFVRYKDNIETDEYWCVNDGRDVGGKQDVENGILVLRVSHNPKDSTWTKFVEGVSLKTVRLEDCMEYILIRQYTKRNGEVAHCTEKKNMTANQFQKEMIKNRIWEL